ncbi:MAG: hypothetical protein ACPGYK_04835 [Flavobacteriales bacterium]
MHRFERVVFHIGFHKTGTTAIQEALTANLALLDESDWCYWGGNFKGRDLGINAWPLMWTLAGGKPGAAIANHPEYLPEMIPIFRQWLEEQAASNLLISSESLWDFSEDHWKKALSHFEPFVAVDADIRMLLMTRHPVSWTLSSFNQAVKVGEEKHPISNYLCANPSVLGALKDKDWMWNNRVMKLEIKRYEDMLQGGLGKEFLTWLGVQYDDSQVVLPPPVNASMCLESRWIAQSAIRYENALFDPLFWYQISDLPGTKDGVSAAMAQRIWGQWGESMNAMLESFDQPMYSFDEGFKPVVVERLWPSSCLNAWRTRVLSLSRSSAKRIHRVMQNLQPDIPVSEWPAEVQSRFKQLKHMIWLRAHFPKVVSSLGIWLVYTER